MSLEKSNNQFGIALFFTIFIAIACGVFILVFGKEESFFLINGNHNNYLDFFFKYYTYTGDGWMWLTVLLFCLFFRKKYVLAVLLAVVISTLLSQFFKRVIFPEDLRPITYLSDNFPVHIVEGVKMNRLFSFPSGHSVAAFTMALLLAYIINKKSWSIILPILALLAGYSRVYLAQHFLTDVVAGIIIGIVSTLFSLMIYRAIFRNRNKKSN
ncbi:MAG TPA: phosphatase PAP2 family protein [Chitinophagaceae bacterium]|nr:phosphatase PAP2 family protein [Chitinophagaceae bacterium]